jgi:hypothetical protein
MERKESDAPEAREEVYLYHHSGIYERRGIVPLWLIGVAIGLLVWAVYYTITYWSAE